MQKRDASKFFDTSDYVSESLNTEKETLEGPRVHQPEGTEKRRKK